VAHVQLQEPAADVQEQMVPEHLHLHPPDEQLALSASAIGATEINP